MDIRIKEKLKNQQGSSLAFVLIIGMVIMIMVASLLAVANSDFTFTQETVESRQAYIDAKSVIEFGKIEINNRQKQLSEAYDALVKATNDKKDTTLIKQTIADLESKVTTVYGDDTNVASTLSFSNSGEKIALGQISVEKTSSVVNAADTSQYVFKVETENLRRKLDYKVDFNYVVTTTPGSAGTLVIPTKPIAPVAMDAPSTNTSSWLSTQITRTNNWPEVQCKIATTTQKVTTSANNVLTVDASGFNIKVDTFEWANSPTLNLSANNIDFKANVPTSNIEGASFNITASNELRFEGNYLQNYNQNKINKLKAKNIIFEGNLEIGSNTGIEIECDTLWIKGDLIFNTNNKDIINRIKAKNIIVENVSNQNKGNITINGASNVVWENLGNLWIGGNLNFNNWNSGKIENRISADNIIISNTNNQKNGNLTVTSYSKIEIICKENFWAGNVSIAANDSSLTSMISAKNIVIEDTTNNKNGNIVIGDKTNVIWDATNFWLDGELTTKSSSAKVTFKNINYLTTGNIDLDYMSYLTIEGAANMKNHIKVGAIKAVNSNDVHIKISNLCSFECDGIDLNWNSSLELDSSIIKINGNFNLVQPKAPLTLTCEYFDCIGKTTIYRLQNEMNFNPKNATLNIRFNGGYEQTNSVVNVNGADKVIFGNYDANNGGGNDKKIKFVQDNQHTLKLNVRADAIYLNSNTIEIPANGDFAFGGKNGGTTKTFNIKTNISGKVGNYSDVSGNKIEDLSGSGGLPYAPPTWPDPLVCSCVGGSSTTVTSSPGTETYY